VLLRQQSASVRVCFRQNGRRVIMGKYILQRFATGTEVRLEVLAGIMNP